MSAAGVHWNGEYGLGAGQAHRSVERVECPLCKSPPGKLCVFKTGPALETHYLRRYALKNLEKESRRARRWLEASRGAKSV